MYMVELIGTMIVSCTFSIVTQPNITYYTSVDSTIEKHQESFIAPVAVGFVVIALIYAFGHISGAHFNPSITVAVFLRCFITRRDALLFVAVQLVGALVGALLAFGISGEVPFIEPGEAYQAAYGRVVVVELIYSFAISLVVINVATTESQRGNFFYGVSIGMCQCAAVAAAQKISGGAFHPAVGTALSLTNAVRSGGTLRFIWIYWLGPMLGGLLGGLSYYVLNAKEMDNASKARAQQVEQSLM